MTDVHVAPGAYTAPQRAMAPEVYLDPAVFAAERDAVLARSWQYACHASELADPGDFVAFEVAGEPLFTLRGRDGVARTFYNVCMHRGHELVAGRGSRKLLVCPYHAWSYQLDGRLHRAPHAADDVDLDGICLTPVPTEDFLGFVFVNLDTAAPAMDELFPGVRGALREFLPGIEAMRPLERRSFVAEANWKAAVENYNECYHCRHVHKSFSKGVVLPDSYTIRPVGRCLRHEAEAAPDQYYPIDHAASPHAAEYSSFYLWPLFSFQVYPGPVLNTFCWRPKAVDRTPFFREWFTPGGADNEVVRSVAKEDAETTVAEDLALLASVQRGMASRGYRPGPLIIDPEMGVNSEHTVAALKAWYQEAMGG